MSNKKDLRAMAAIIFNGCIIRGVAGPDHSAGDNNKAIKFAVACGKKLIDRADKEAPAESDMPPQSVLNAPLPDQNV